MPLAPAGPLCPPGARRRRAGGALALALAVVLTACTPTQGGSTGAVLRPTSSPAVPTTPATAAPEPSGAVDRARASVDLPVQPLDRRRVPDVLVVGAASAPARERLLALSSAGESIGFGTGTVTLGGADASAVAVDASAFRSFTAPGTAEADAVWQAVARGEAVVSHEAAQARGLSLGQDVDVAGPRATATLRLGAFATTGLPATDLVVDEHVGRRLGLAPDTGMLLVAADGQDPADLAEQVRGITGDAAEVDLLTAPAADPVASLTGGEAARELGAFSYRYYADGTIEPDADWVRAHIRTETVPVLGRVTCHRLMLPQLRGALAEVEAAGLASTLTTYDGCYVPRFIERDPSRSISLHTWGIAIDLDAATNYRGIRGTMDARVVEIFKRWGFRWGGDWAYTDPMHFELMTLLEAPPG